MSKIFVVSLHRCATQSTELFLRRAGFRTCHWPAIVNGVDYQSKVIGAECSPREIVYILKPVFDSFEAFDDVPLPVLYAELDADYPNSRFIAIHRDPGDWIRSVRRRCHSRPLDPYERAQYWRDLPSQPITLDTVSDTMLRGLYTQHYEDLVVYFRQRTNFLWLELRDPAIGLKLSSFLGITTAEFPHFDYKDPTTYDAQTASGTA